MPQNRPYFDFFKGVKDKNKKTKKADIMKILEISKKYCEQFYNNNYNLIIQENDGVLYDDARIKQTFNNGNGTIKDFKKYMNNNKQFCKFYDLTKKCFI